MTDKTGVMLLIEYQMRNLRHFGSRNDNPWITFCGVFRSWEYFNGAFRDRELSYNREIGRVMFLGGACSATDRRVDNCGCDNCKDWQAPPMPEGVMSPSILKQFNLITAEMVVRGLNAPVLALGGGLTVNEYLIEGGKKYWSPNRYLWGGAESAQAKVLAAALVAALEGELDSKFSQSLDASESQPEGISVKERAALERVETVVSGVSSNRLGNFNDVREVCKTLRRVIGEPSPLN